MGHPLKLDRRSQRSLERQVYRAFRVKPQSDSSFDGTGTLMEVLGFPSLFSVSILLSDDMLRSLRTVFPSQCCVCLARPSVWLDCHERRGLISWGQGKALVNGVPHCDLHGRDSCVQLAAVLLRDAIGTGLLLVGENGEFLDQVAELNWSEPQPPWILFLGSTPMDGLWRQGVSEWWFENEWQPFWWSLSEPQRADYLRRWDAPEEWIEFVEKFPIEGMRSENDA